MKAKYYIGILALLLISSTGVITAAIEMRNFDFHYSSRINRFHRSYNTFSYYSPVFTDTYWYNWQPLVPGMSIYSGAGFGIGFGFGFNFPVYNYPVYQQRVSYYNGWYDPWYYAGYDPFYYNGWYSPAYVSISYRNNWPHNNYGWNSHNNWYYSQPAHYSYNNYNTYNTYNNYNSYRSDKGDKGGKDYSTNNNNTTYRNNNNNRANSANIANRTNSTNSTNSTNNTQINSRREAAPKREAIAGKAPAVSGRTQDNYTARSYENRSGNVNSISNSPVGRDINTGARAYSRAAVKNSAPVANQPVRRAEAPARQERSAPEESRTATGERSAAEKKPSGRR